MSSEPEFSLPIVSITINKNMNYELTEIIGSIVFSETGEVYIKAKSKEYETIADYLNCFDEEAFYQEEINLFNKIDEYNQLKTYEERWDYFEMKFGGNEMEGEKEYGWLSLSNYTPNLVMRRETKEFFLAYLLEDKIDPNYPVNIDNIKMLLREWMELKMNKYPAHHSGG